VVAFSQVFPLKPRMHLSFPTRATCPAHLILHNLNAHIIFNKASRESSSLLCSHLLSPVTSYLLGQNILLSTLFSKTLSLHSFQDIGYQVSHPYKTTGKIVFLCVLISTFLDRKLGRQKILQRMTRSIPRLQSALNFFIKCYIQTCVKWGYVEVLCNHL
jgi:hypothetical protein